MKRTILIVSSLCLIIPFVFLGVSAYDPIDSPVRDDLVRSVSPSYTYTYLVFNYPPYSRPTSNIGIYSGGTYMYDGVSIPFSSLGISSSVGDVILYAYGDVNHGLILADGSLNPLWDGYIYFNSPATLSDSFANWYNSFSVVDSSVYSGVTSSLTFSGQVLNFITSSQGILALLGLSIALVLIVPFSIRKLKEFVKGY